MATRKIVLGFALAVFFVAAAYAESAPTVIAMDKQFHFTA